MSVIFMASSQFSLLSRQVRVELNPIQMSLLGEFLIRPPWPQLASKEETLSLRRSGTVESPT